jgi:hypothetical protein
MLTSALIAEPLMNAAGYSFPVDRVPLLPGTLIFATVLAALLTTTASLPVDHGPRVGLDGVSRPQPL